MAQDFDSPADAVAHAILANARLAAEGTTDDWAPLIGLSREDDQ